MGGQSAQKIKTPPHLSAQDKSSFAYKTIKDRLPVILVKTIDFFHRQRKELHKFTGSLEAPGETNSIEIEKNAKEVIAQIAGLRKDLETDKPLQFFDKLEGLGPDYEYFNDDIEQWNKALEEARLDDKSMPRWFESPWLLVECYLYRRLKETMLKTSHLKVFDPFVEQKRAACRASLTPMAVISNHLIEVEKVVSEATNHSHPSERTEFSLFMQLALWANKSDLSLNEMSADKIQSQKLAINIRDSLDSLQENVLCDNMSEVWFKIQSIKSEVRDIMKRGDKPKQQIYIDLVADNSGYEVFVDFCLIHFLSLLLCGGQENEVVKFRIHLKRMPWFVSDALKQDVDWLLKFLTASEQDSNLQAIGQKWKSFLDSNYWQLEQHKYWTLPNDYSEMQSIAPDLYSQLSESKLIIFKGDLNYRKLTGDRKWHILTPFRAALRGFMPAPLVALRTAKADIVVGIEDVNIFAKINNNELPRDWMISGDFGLIQFVDPL